MNEGFFEKIRENMITIMQKSLKSIRLMMDLSAQQLGELIGVTRQTINNLEQGRNTMTASQYIAICAVVDHIIKEKPEIKDSILLTLKISEDDDTSLLDRWFMAFDDEKKAMFEVDKELDYYDMDTLARNYKIFISYDSLMNYWENESLFKLMCKMKKWSNRMIVPLRVVDMIQKYIFSSDSDKSIRAKKAFSLLNRWNESGEILIKGAVDDGTVEDVILTVLEHFKVNRRLALITQDQELARKVQELNDICEGFPIKVIRLYENKLKMYPELGESEEYCTIQTSAGRSFTSEMDELSQSEENSENASKLLEDSFYMVEDYDSVRTAIKKKPDLTEIYNNRKNYDDYEEYDGLKKSHDGISGWNTIL